MKFFDYDGPLYRFGTNIFDLFLLNVIWIFISGLSFGLLMGNAIVSLYHTVDRYIINGEGTLLKVFFERFKQRFLISFIYSVLSLIIIAFSAYNVYLLLTNNTQISWMAILFVAIIIYWIFISPYIIALLSRSSLKLKVIFIYSFALAFKNFFISLLCLVIILVVVAISYYTWFIGTVVFIAPAMLLISIMLEKHVFPKYETDQDQ